MSSSAVCEGYALTGTCDKQSCNCAHDFHIIDAVNTMNKATDANVTSLHLFNCHLVVGRNDGSLSLWGINADGSLELKIEFADSKNFT